VVMTRSTNVNVPLFFAS